MVTVQECLTWTVGRGGIKHLTPWEGTKISSPCAFGARGRNFYTFPWGEVFYTSPSDCSGKVHSKTQLEIEFTMIWFIVNVSYQEIRYTYKYVDISARSSSLFIELEFHWVSNCQVRTCIKLDFCLSILSLGFSYKSFSGFFELEFSRVRILRVKTRRVFEFRVARSGTSCLGIEFQPGVGINTNWALMYP